MYFPRERAVLPVTNFARYASANVPHADVTSVLVVPDGDGIFVQGPIGRKTSKSASLAGLVTTGVVEDDQSIASIHTIHVDYAYPVPTLTRDAALHTIQPWLMERGIYARGRFGAWRYEMGTWTTP